MSKWEDSFKKTLVENNGSKMCHCLDNEGLFVPNRQLSIVVAVCLLLGFSVFMAGYFLGKKKSVEQFTEKLQQEAFADKIYTTVLCTPQEDQQPTKDMLLVTSEDDSNAPSQLVSFNEPAFVQQEVSSQLNSTGDTRYYAQLIGFGTEKAAQLFVKKLAAKGIETDVKKRMSKTVKGNTSYWYQVVTTQYSNKDDLSALVDKLAKEENIKDACIRVC